MTKRKNEPFNLEIRAKYHEDRARSFEQDRDRLLAENRQLKTAIWETIETSGFADFSDPTQAWPHVVQDMLEILFDVMRKAGEK